MGKTLSAWLSGAALLVLTVLGGAQEPGQKDAPPEKKDPTQEKKDTTPPKKEGAAESPEPVLYGRTMSEWLKLLKDKDSADRGEAAKALAEMGKAARPATAALVPPLQDPKDPYGRRLAAYVLAYNRPTPNLAVPALLAALKDKDVVVRRQAATALVYLGSAVKPRSASLVELLKDADPDVRLLAAYVLGYLPFDRRDRDVVQALSDATRDKDETVRRTAGEGLKRIDPEAAGRMGIR
jgi:HEAT repeat protein